jgi:molybdopterin-containing oxidoreductase family iron-sulfur binding subunit
MEKCTYCIQRITSTRLDIEKTQVRLEAAGSAASDVVAQMQQLLDSLQTACQQACPAEAIVFGNINPAKEPIAGNKSRIVVLKELPLNYGILTDLNTVPRTTYMARLRNPPSPVSDATTAPEKPT